MSVNSPAKQERIERHLMRQRGAGVRTISATFGFSFGTSAISSNDVTPSSSHEPPAKRRKSNLDTVTTADGIAVASQTNGSINLGAKRRRRLDLADDENTSRPTLQGNEQEDSFVTGLGRAKKRPVAKKREKQSAPGDCMAQESTANEDWSVGSRPRRRAAATAAILVADGFAEEAIPIDKKRRAVDPKGKSKNAVPKEHMVSANTVEVSCPEPSTAVDAEVQSKRRLKERSRKARAADTRAVEITQPEEFPTGEAPNAEEPTAFTVKPRASQARKRKTESIEDKPSQTVRGPAWSKKVQRHPEKKTEAVTPIHETSRQPLKQTDTNITRRSTSPNKTAPDMNDVSQFFLKPGDPTKQAHAVRERSVASQDVHQKQNITKSTELAETSKADEDVDWLFEFQAAPRRPQKVEERVKPARLNAKSQTKIADIDLDDLLSNIASFAATVKAVGVGNGEIAAKTAAKATRRR